MAPEVYRHEPYNSKVDVYSFSMIAFQLLEGYPPFWTMDPIQAARRAAIEGLRPEWGAFNRCGLACRAREGAGARRATLGASLRAGLRVALVALLAWGAWRGRRGWCCTAAPHLPAAPAAPALRPPLLGRALPQPPSPQPPSSTTPTPRRFGKVVPPACKKLVERCWANSFDDRPDFDEVVSVLDGVIKGMPAPTGGAGGGGCCTVQ
jgi:serine/threonine protein kinase